jgi:hypothetical protein
MTTWFFILAYAVGPLLMAFGVILIQRRLRGARRGATTGKAPDDARNGAASEYVANQLERLMALPLSTASGVERWDAESNDVQQYLGEHYPQFEPEEEMRHFFDDADIRSRDADYRVRQHGLMAEYVRRLRQR